MRYKNMKTGAVVETDCVCRGADWQEEKPARSSVPSKTAAGKKRAVKKNDQLCGD